MVDHCDGGCDTVAPLGLLSLGGHANLRLCRECWSREMRWRRARNRDLAPESRYPLPAWEEYEPESTDIDAALAADRAWVRDGLSRR